MTLGRTLVGLLLLGGSAGFLVTGADFFSRMLYLGLILAVGAGIWVVFVARSLRLSRRPDFWKASVGDIFKEQYQIENASRLPATWVELFNEMPIPIAAGSRLLTHLSPHQEQTFVARTWLTRRGSFPAGPTLLTTADPLGLFRVRKRFPAQRSLVVLPMIFPIAGFMSPPGLPSGGQVIRRKAMEITPHASGVRGYVAGDPMKRIHWPTSVRRGELIVKEFEQDPQSEVWIFLDAQHAAQAEKAYEAPAMPVEHLLFSRKPALSLPPSTLEYEISIAASLAHYFIAQKRAVGFVAQDRTYAMIAAERSERQEAKILETLAFLEGRGNLSIAALASAHGRLLPSGSSVILVTSSTSTDLLLAADDLQRRRLRPVVLLLVAATFGGARGTDQIAAHLQQHRVPFRLVECGANLSEVLSGFPPLDDSQVMAAWQKPVLSHLT